MNEQRTAFFSEIPEESVRKDGLNEPVWMRRFGALPVEEIEIRFTNRTVTQFGGYPLWRTFLDEYGLKAKLAQYIKISRGKGFTAPELSSFFIDTRILGAKRLEHIDAMRHDPLLCRTYGLDYLSSDETMGRYFKSYEENHLASMERLNTSTNNQMWKKARRKGVVAAKNRDIILDYDSSTMTVYGKQEGADRGRSFRKKDKPGYQPKFAFIGGLGVMLNQQLYPQSVSLPGDFESFHERTKAKLPKTARIWGIRGDGALYSEERVEWMEEKYIYGISAKRTSHLKTRIIEIPEEDWEDEIDKAGKPYSIARIQYRPSKWKEERTYIISRRLMDLKGQQVLWEHEKYKYFAYVTNHPGGAYEQFRFCVERCSLENFIKEAKSGLYYDFLPCAELNANRAYLGHVQLAYNLLIWWKLLKTLPAVNRWTADTLRMRLFNVCGNLKKYMGKWILTLPEQWPWRTLYMQLAASAGLVPS